MGSRKWYVGLAGFLALAGCGTAPKQKTKVQPPSKAFVTQSLPLRPYGSLLRSPYAKPVDPVDVLIARAEELYEEGLEDYRGGNVDKARAEFDQALTLLLESKLDLPRRERITSEVSKLVDDIQSLASPDAERGDLPPLHSHVPAPIESFTGLTFPVDPKVKEKVKQEVESVRSDLPLVFNDYVAGVINFFQVSPRGQEFIRKIIERSGLYQPIIAAALRKEGLPRELIYMAGAESAFNPTALSHAGAKGIWQFMLERGFQYGLKKSRWVDDREDPVKSTSAAVRHLKDLYQMFGDWYLAMAAYDSGPITIQRAVEKTGYADFWMLRRLGALPKETENYVPIFLAAASIAKDPRAFGFDVKPLPPLAYDTVVVSVPTDLRLVAQLIEKPVEDLIRLNPSLLRWTTPPNDPQFVLYLPPGTKQAYEQGIAAIPPDRRVWWRVHKVEDGETLAGVARKFRVSGVVLARVNQVAPYVKLGAGRRLVIPLASGKESSLVRVRERTSLRLIRYRIRRSDTLQLVADRFDVTPYQIRRWNRLRGSRLVAGRTLRIYVPGGPARTRQAGARRGRQLSSRSPSTKPGVTQADATVARPVGAASR